MARKCATCTPKCTWFAKPCSLIKQVSSLQDLYGATNTSWLWCKSIATPSLLSPWIAARMLKMIPTYNALLLWLKRAGIVPKKHVLDNEESENMKNHIFDTCKFDMELVPPGCHQRNAAKVAICNFNAHFLSILAGVADDFPPNLWDWLLPQTEITINLIWQSNATPNVLAYAHLSRLFNYNKMPLALMGCEAQVHKKTDKCSTWAYHLVDWWYLFT